MKIEDVLVIKDFLDVFPEKLMSLSPEREVEFKIELTLERTSISKNSYRMTPAKFKKLKIQLQDLLK